MALILLLAVSVIVLNQYFPNPLFPKLYYSTLAFAVTYGFFSIFIYSSAKKRLADKKAVYSFRKVLSAIHLLVLSALLILIWVEDPFSVLIAYGIIGAGAAIALQDVFKSVAGGIFIFVAKPFRVGDRISINSRTGDVMDIGLFYTTLLETGGWIKGDQPSGRLIIVPNNAVLSQGLDNYTKDHEFIWDEITLPITYDSDCKEAQKILLSLVSRETKQAVGRANKEISKLEEKYYLEAKATEPSVFVKLTDNWIELGVRYITETRRRRATNSYLSQLILEAIKKSKNVRIASETIDVSVSRAARRKKKSGV